MVTTIAGTVPGTIHIGRKMVGLVLSVTTMVADGITDGVVLTTTGTVLIALEILITDMAPATVIITPTGTGTITEHQQLTSLLKTVIPEEALLMAKGQPVVARLFMMEIIVQDQAVMWAVPTAEPS